MAPASFDEGENQEEQENLNREPSRRILWQELIDWREERRAAACGACCRSHCDHDGHGSRAVKCGGCGGNVALCSKRRTGAAECDGAGEPWVGRHLKVVSSGLPCCNHRLIRTSVNCQGEVGCIADERDSLWAACGVVRDRDRSRLGASLCGSEDYRY